MMRSDSARDVRAEIRSEILSAITACMRSDFALEAHLCCARARAQHWLCCMRTEMPS